MAKRRIFTIGFDLPGDAFEYVSFESDQSLLDADIVLFEPGFGDMSPTEHYEGERLFSHYESPRVAQYLAHWRSELVSCVNAGKLAVIFCAKPLRHYRYSGEKTFSGTGRSRVTTNLVQVVTSYSAVPNIDSVEAKSGREVKLTKDAGFLASYWKDFASYSSYEAFIQGKFTSTLITTRAADKIVAAAFHGRGWLLFLPPLRYEEKKFVKWTEKSGEMWTAEAVKFGDRLTAAVIALEGALVGSRTGTPPPAWAQDVSFATDEEVELQSRITKVTGQIAKLQASRTDLEEKLRTAGRLRGLLFEQGRPLEHAVREALTLLGFAAKPFQNAESEFDVVFESAEGRFLGEVEGKDSRAINIDKLSQLERNLQEDFARDDVSAFAKGVLFGNNERLVPPTDRGAAFTEKCMLGAKRAGIALVRTSDLFEPARYLRSHPDAAYAERCRRAIFDTIGDIVAFPVPPLATTSATAESTEVPTSAAPDVSGGD